MCVPDRAKPLTSTKLPGEHSFTFILGATTYTAKFTWTTRMDIIHGHCVEPD